MTTFLSYKILPGQRLILANFQGRIELKDFIDLSMQMAQDEAYSSSYSVIFDFRESQSVIFKIDTDDYFKFLGQLIHIPCKVYVAFLTNSTNWKFLIQSNLPKAQEMNMEVARFESLGETLNWMGIPPEEFDDIKNALKSIKTTLPSQAGE